MVGPLIKCMFLQTNSHASVNNPNETPWVTCSKTKDLNKSRREAGHKERCIKEEDKRLNMTKIRYLYEI